MLTTPTTLQIDISEAQFELLHLLDLAKQWSRNYTYARRSPQTSTYDYRAIFIW